MNNLTFGPITSRRFGLSLGVDLSPETKQCNFDCIYCELKGAKPVSKINNPPSVKDIINAVKQELTKNPNIDVITLTANGEPTLYPYLDELVDELNAIKTTQKLLILSNSSTITDELTCKTLNKIDIVKLSLDCVSEKCFKRIDRPIKGLHVKEIIEGIQKFRKSYTGQLILEILVVKGINDKEDEFILLDEVIKKIKPNRVDIGTIDRPPAYDVKGVSAECLENLSSFITNAPLSIAKKRDYKEIKQTFSKEELLVTLAKRPFCADDVEHMLDDKTKVLLEALVSEKLGTCKDTAGVSFYMTRER